jgi:L-arabinokinase
VHYKGRSGVFVKHFIPSSMPPEGAGALHLFQLIDASVPDYFDPLRPVHVGRAPGRLDVMGGIADYSGALVLQLPLAEAACAAVQARDDDELHAWSPSSDGSRTSHVRMTLAALGLPDQPVSYAEARAVFAAEPKNRWAAYVLGAVLVLARERSVRFHRGLAVLLRSDVPEGKGVSSSAAIEVATMHAICALEGVRLTGRELALLCQKVENEIAGAPCGVMDQMTAACGEANALLALRCQPCELEGTVELPESLEVIGLDSGVRHAVAGSDYTAVRIGAFMGYRILAELRGLSVRADAGAAVIDDPAWRGYLCNCDAGEFRTRWLDALPESLTGAEFLARYGGSTDAVTTIDPARRYAVRVPTRHPVEENARVQRFRALLEAPLSPATGSELGDLMFASHDSYSACGLGSESTDWIVEQVRQRRARGVPLLGAKITGGGSGGTVAILGERTKVWHETLRIKKELAARLGHAPELFRWSSPGAIEFGTLRLAPRAGCVPDCGQA